MAEIRRRAWPQRAVAVAALLVASLVSLPLAASIFDRQGSENWILPVQLAAMALLGAVVGFLLPALAGVDSTPARGARVGAAVGVATSVVGVVIFFLLLSGLSGA